LNLNFKVFFKYILLTANQLFFKYLFRNDKNTNLITTQINLYHLIMHVKLSSVFYSTQLIDIFAYDVPLNTNVLNNDDDSLIPLLNNCVIAYNFHSIFFQQRFFVFILNSPIQNINKISVTPITLNSITELFSNAN
jgi:hypothetical protein